MYSYVFAMFSYVLLRFATFRLGILSGPFMFSYVLLCFCYVLAYVFAYVFLCLLYVFPMFPYVFVVFLLCFCYVLLRFATFCLGILGNTGKH